MPEPDVPAGIFDDDAFLDEAVAADAAPADAAPAVPREPQVGDEVLHGGKRAQVLKVHPPGGVDAALDLLIYHGATPEAIGRAAHDLGSGWCWPGESPPPPPTLAQKLAALHNAGVRVPRVGDEVRAVSPSGVASDNPLPYFSRRARVLEVQGVSGDKVEVRLGIFANEEPPEDPRAPDPLAGFQPYEGMVGPLGPEDRRPGWAWPGWVSPRRLTEEELLPRSPCTRCGRPWPHRLRIPIYATATFGPWKFSNGGWRDALAYLCEPCADSLFTFAKTPPTAPPAPAA